VGSNGVTATSEAEDDSILLGDTDLVRAILHDAEGVGPTALRLMRQHTAWHDLVIVETPPCESDGSSVVAIRSEGRTFGHLVSDQASADALRGWASWLGTWLALDDAHRDLRVKAYQDDLTGAWNRRFFDAFMAKTIAEAARQRRTLTVLVFDIDNFKTFNDSYGHEAGDEILRETVRLLNSVIRQGDRVCRIGGDEFCVVFSDPEGPREPGSCLPETAELLARRFQDQICQMKFPKLGCDAPGRLSISGGLASYPWDGRTAAELLRHADHLALASKRCGKNVITFGPGAAQLRPESREPRTDSSKTP
ncbi:MAG: GGDEF domain-containing protein, partial [Phycisphaerales bacterium]|nr:GGDEF domain-containing protein [Phycisphaerales bacterium]